MLKKIITIVAFLSLCHTTQANPDDNRWKWIPNSKLIDALFVVEDWRETDEGVALIRLRGFGDEDVPYGCKPHELSFSLKNKKGEKMFDLALAAHLEERPVRLHLRCKEGEMEINAIKIGQ